MLFMKNWFGVWEIITYKSVAKQHKSGFRVGYFDSFSFFCSKL